MKQREYRYFMGDFETTVYKGQVNTEVWASALVELFTDKVTILHSIAETFDYLVSLNCNVVVYYHNLKFDGAFWLSYLLVDKKFTQAYDKIGDKETDVKWKQQFKMFKFQNDELFSNLKCLTIPLNTPYLIEGCGILS